jgi:enoyl-CoA hydratase/carnithine racemase
MPTGIPPAVPSPVASPVRPAIPVEAGFRLEIAGEVATITLDRADRLNSQVPDMWIWLGRAGALLPATVRIVVVRGAGRAFSAGLDRAVFGELMNSEASPLETADIARYQAGFGWLARPDLVSVAAVQGHAIGAGFQLALACDIRIAADNVQFAMAETSLGLVPDLGGTKRLVELVGYSRAVDICLTARRIQAEEALRIGLVARVVALDALDAAVEELLRSMLGSPRDALIETKALLLAAAGRSQGEQEAAERAAQHRRLRDLRGLEAET